MRDKSASLLVPDTRGIKNMKAWEPVLLPSLGLRPSHCPSKQDDNSEAHANYDNMQSARLNARAFSLTCTVIISMRRLLLLILTPK